MAFMKRDVNFGLLILIIASIVLFIGFTIYYQTTFKDVSLEYQTKMEQLREVTNELAVQKQELNETYSMKIKAEQDRRALDQSYKEVSDENEQLKADNANLRSEISSTKSQLAEKSAELEATNIILAQTQEELVIANNRISSLNRDLNEVCNDYESATGEEHEEC